MRNFILKRSEACLILALLSLSVFSAYINTAKVGAAVESGHSYTIFQDGFEDGDAEGWTIDIPPDAPENSRGGVEREDGNYVLSEEGHVWAEVGFFEWTDYTFEVNFKLLTGSGPQINFRMTSNGRYLVGLYDTTISLKKERPPGTFYDFGSTRMSIELNTWHTVKIVVVGNSIEVYLDDALKLSYADDVKPHLSGRIGLESAPGSHVHFDDVRVSTTQRLYTVYLINMAQNEIDKAEGIGADVSEAEKKLEEAKTNLDTGNLDAASSLASEAIELAKHADVGLRLVGELLDYPKKYDGRTVELFGTIRDISYDQGIYRFVIDDGSGVISATFDGSLGDIKSEDSVRVVGIFDASTMTVVSESLERIAKLPGEELHTYVIFEDGFEDGDYEGWTTWHEGVGAALAVEVEGGNHVLSGKGGEGFYNARPWESKAWSYITDKWTDYTFEIRLKLIKMGDFQLSFRMTDWPHRYYVHVNPWRYIIGKQTGPQWPEDFHQLGGREEALDLNRWYTLKIVCVESNIKVYVDDVLKIRYVDTDKPHLFGGIALSLQRDSYVYFDDVKVSTTQRLYVDHLLNVAQYEIKRAREVAADTGEAEQKLAEVQTALDAGNLDLASSLAQEAIELAKHASMGRRLVGDLLGSPAMYDRRTVELLGTIRDIRYEDGKYKFVIDDGTDVISAAYERTLGDIRSEDVVRVVGVFDASTETVFVESVERVTKPPTPGEEQFPYLLFRDDFEDGDTYGWRIDLNTAGAESTVEVEDGNRVLSYEEGVHSETGMDVWTDYFLQVRVKVIGGKDPRFNVGIRWRYGYIVHFSYNHLRLEKEMPGGWITLTHTAVSLSPNVWYTVKVVGFESNVKVYVDNVLKIDYTDDVDPSLTGRIVLGTGPGSHVHFDDVEVYATQRCYAIHLIDRAQFEINKAREIRAEVGDAEQRLRDAKTALKNDELDLAVSSAEKAFKLAEHASVGQKSVEGLLGSPTLFHRRTVELLGTIRDIAYVPDKRVYRFAVDDGTGTILAVFNQSMGDIKNEDRVKVAGIFNAEEKVVFVKSIEKVTKTVPGEELPEEALYTFVIFKDDFEDGDASDWRVNIDPRFAEYSAWKVVREGDNYVLSGEGHIFSSVGDPEWTNYVFEVRVKIIKPAVHINFRLSRDKRYFVSIGFNHLALRKQSTPEVDSDLAHVEVDLSPNTWYNIKIVCFDNNVKVYLDDELKFDYTDEDNPHLSGNIGLEPVPGPQEKPSHILFDDVRVSKPMTTGDIDDLINYAQSEIDEAKALNADTRDAEEKLARAKTALSQENYQLVQYLVDDAVQLARRSNVGSVPIRDLKAMPQYSGHTVEISGTVRNLEARPGAYEFAIDDGTDVIKAVFQGVLGDIKKEDRVKVAGVFDASSMTVNARSVAMLERATPQPVPAPFGLPMQIDPVAIALTLIMGIGGGVGWMMRRRSEKRKKRKIKELLDEIDNVYT
ncbi:MAG: family 16 glycoside hydrolase, partial [Candidatus Geothermarchaeales archaeon]